MYIAIMPPGLWQGLSLSLKIAQRDLGCVAQHGSKLILVLDFMWCMHYSLTINLECVLALSGS